MGSEPPVFIIPGRTPTSSSGPELRNGVPTLSINHGSGTLTLQLPLQASITDHRWHRLDVISDGKVVQLMLDQCGGAQVNEVEGLVVEATEMDQSGCMASGETPGSQRYLNVYQPLQLGGMKEISPHRRYRSYTGCIRNLQVDSQGYAWFPPIRPCFQSHISLDFLAQSANGLLLYNGPLGPAHPGEPEDFIAIGCLSDVRLNGHSLPLDGRSSELVVLLERRAVTAGCSSDACGSRPCRGPLYCVDLWRKHECRCPGSQVTVTDEASGQERCVPSPCQPSSCRNGGVCQPLSPDSFHCRCQDRFRGQHCELGQVKGHRLAALSPSSILAISMCLLVFFAVLVAVTVWNQKGSRSKFRKRGVYHIPAEHASWEDIRENILNYNEEGGGEQDQNAYDITELKRPLCSSLSQSSSCTTAPLIKSSNGSQEEVHPSGSSCSSGAPYLSIPNHHHHHHHHHHQHHTGGNTNYAADANDANSANEPQCANRGTPINVDGETKEAGAFADAILVRSHSQVDFKSYVARIIWEADNDGDASPLDAYHVWCVEGAGSSVGSLSSLGSAASANRPGDQGEEAGFGHDRLVHWGPKFQALSNMYDRPQLDLSYRDAVSYIHRSHSQDLLPHPH
ncbi:hypothetical protein CRUP_012030 [Coryphaenoides rupestris]|nr:hypothetical protein CRUP_012030 [Coryphaenoides rupestris]